MWSSGAGIIALFEGLKAYREEQLARQLAVQYRHYSLLAAEASCLRDQAARADPHGLLADGLEIRSPAWDRTSSSSGCVCACAAECAAFRDI